LRSAEDERRHTRAMCSLARRAGAEPTLPQCEAGPARAPYAVALENAVEGLRA
jgi:hypothetical protein